MWFWRGFQGVLDGVQWRLLGSLNLVRATRKEAIMWPHASTRRHVCFGSMKVHGGDLWLLWWHTSNAKLSRRQSCYLFCQCFFLAKLPFVRLVYLTFLFVLASIIMVVVSPCTFVFVVALFLWRSRICVVTIVFISMLYWLRVTVGKCCL